LRKRFRVGKRGKPSENPKRDPIKKKDIKRYDLWGGDPSEEEWKIKKKTP